MATYLGEEYRIVSVTRDFDHVTPLTPDDGAFLTVTVWAPDATIVREDESMTFNADDSVSINQTTYQGFWYYIFDTSDLTLTGKYKYKVTMDGADGKKNWEWGSLRLARDPVPT